MVAYPQAFLSTELSVDRLADPCPLIVVGVWNCFPLFYELLESARLCLVVCGRLRRRCRACSRRAVVWSWDRIGNDVLDVVGEAIGVHAGRGRLETLLSLSSVLVDV